MGLGVPQTLAASVDATTLEGVRQTIALGPVASQEPIKMSGDQWRRLLQRQQRRPFENPSALTNLIQMISIFVLGAGLTWTFGKAVGNTRQGWAILAAMLVLFAAGVSTLYWAEAAGNPILHTAGVAGPNLEGKEVRFGIAASALFAAITTAASCGAVNAMHASLTPIGGMIPLLNMQLGEVVVGGVGAGLFGFLLFAILAIFVAGLMVGRSPEYVGKKIEAREVLAFPAAQGSRENVGSRRRDLPHGRNADPRRPDAALSRPAGPGDIGARPGAVGPRGTPSRCPAGTRPTPLDMAVIRRPRPAHAACRRARRHI